MADKANETTTEEQTNQGDGYEKRYKDSQTHIGKLEQENKELRDTTQKDKDLFDQINPYIDWDKLNTTTPPADDDGYVDKATLNKTVKDLREELNRDRVVQKFRADFPGMVQHEDLVTMYFGKTDARRSTEDRIAKAVENVKALLESEQTKGRETYKSEKKEKAAKEAEVGGLTEAKGPPGEQKEPEGETFEEYVASRKEAVAKARGATLE